jgi:hypothetical protein
MITPALTAEQRAEAAVGSRLSGLPNTRTALVSAIASAIREAEQAVLVGAANDIRCYSDNYHSRSSEHAALMSAILTIEQYAARLALKSQEPA